MKSNKQTSHKGIVNVTGIMFLFCFLVPSLNWALVLSKLIDGENVMGTVKNIMANEVLFRFGITVELIMSVGLIVLATSLYSILKDVNRNFGRLALSLKLVEAALSSAIVLFSFIALNIGGEMVGFVLNHHTGLYAVPMFFLGIDMVIFLYLFLKSRYIPQVLAVFGIISFILIFIHSLMSLLAPQYAQLPVNQIIFYGPSGLFEIIVGIWLLIKGIKFESQELTGIEEVSV